MTRFEQSPDLIREILAMKKKIADLEVRARRTPTASGVAAGSITDVELADGAAKDNLVSSASTMGAAQLAAAIITESKLNLTPQWDSAGTSSLSITATTTGTAQDTGLTLTAAAAGDYMIWTTIHCLAGSTGYLTPELRINGTVVMSGLVGGSAVDGKAEFATFVWYAANVTSGHVVKVTAFRTTANGTINGQNSSLLMQQVGP